MNPCTRRDFAKFALAALPAAALLSRSARAADSGKKGKPNSRVSGVLIGLNVPYSFGSAPITPDEILKNCVDLGLSGVELRTQPIESFMGAPPHLFAPKSAVAAGGAAAAIAEELRVWRKSAPLDKAKAFRRKYEDAGVAIDVMKVDNLFKFDAPTLDYVFNLSKAVGARAISTEISKVDDDHKRVGEAAAKHKVMVGYHGHATTTPEHWEKAFSFSPYNGANVDLGHFIAGNEVSVLDFIRKHHARITHVHVKDRKKQNGPNMPFGEGDTPIKEALRLIRDNRWNMQATIEFEYKVPEGSTRLAEIARAIKYCRDALA